MRTGQVETLHGDRRWRERLIAAGTQGAKPGESPALLAPRWRPTQRRKAGGGALLEAADDKRRPVSTSRDLSGGAGAVCKPLTPADKAPAGRGL